MDSSSLNFLENKQYFFHKDHLGSSTQISDISANIIHHIEYMPYGETFVEQRSNWGTNYKFNGKELDEETGYYYYGARYYNQDISIWLSIDPLSDKYPSMSPYMYCAGNPVILVDPDGREVEISGEEDAKSQYFNELKIGAHELGIKVKMNKNGILSAKYKGKGPISEDGQKFLDAVNSKNINVKINATNSNYADGDPFFGGAFMGNTLHERKIGKDDYLPPINATAYQTVNPNDLMTMDNYFGKPGMTSIHEITESYMGAIISLKNGVPSGNANAPNSVYEQAHHAATPQSGILDFYRFDSMGNQVKKGSSTRIFSVGWAFPNSKKLIKNVQVK